MQVPEQRAGIDGTSGGGRAALRDERAMTDVLGVAGTVAQERDPVRWPSIVRMKLSGATATSFGS